jgi:hypothetical protein
MRTHTAHSCHPAAAEGANAENSLRILGQMQVSDADSFLPGTCCCQYQGWLAKRDKAV